MSSSNNSLVSRDKTYYGGGSPGKKPFKRNKRLLDLTIMEKDENKNLKTFIRRAKKFGTKHAINSYFQDPEEGSTVDKIKR